MLFKNEDICRHDDYRGKMYFKQMLPCFPFLKQDHIIIPENGAVVEDMETEGGWGAKTENTTKSIDGNSEINKVK